MRELIKNGMITTDAYYSIAGVETGGRSLETNGLERDNGNCVLMKNRECEVAHIYPFSMLGYIKH